MHTHTRVLLAAAEEGNFQRALLASLNLNPHYHPVKFLTLHELENPVFWQHPPEMMILDLQETGPGDEQLVRSLHVHWPDTPCMMLVEHSSQMEMAHQMGCDCLFKGFAVAQLFENMGRMLERETEAKPA